MSEKKKTFVDITTKLKEKSYLKYWEDAKLQDGKCVFQKFELFTKCRF